MSLKIEKQEQVNKYYVSILNMFIDEVDEEYKSSKSRANKSQQSNKISKLSKTLPIKIQHPYHYSKWDAINEPYNVGK